MAHKDPNAPSTTPVPTTTQVTTPDKKFLTFLTWYCLWLSILAVIIFKLFGIVGGLVTYGSYYWLKPTLGKWGAAVASSVIGAAAAIGLLVIIR